MTTSARKAILRLLAILAILASLAGAWWLYQQLQNRRIPILMYHRIGDEGNSVWWVHVADFDNQLKFLKANGYESILPSDLVAHRRWGKPLPEKPVIFTFDDGYLNSLQNAEPLLKKYGFRGVVYLVTGKIAENISERGEIDGTPVLTWPEVREMYLRGTLTFGGHSRSHTKLLLLQDPYWEIRGSYTDIEKKAGFKPEGFCYPNGHYEGKILPAVKRAGFTTALSCNNGLFETGNPVSLYKLPRLAVYGGDHVYHVERLPIIGNTSSISLKVWKDGANVPSFPKLSIPGMEHSEGWKDPVSISTNPVVLTWDIPRDKLRTPLSFELWGDCKLLPHWRQSISITNNL